MSKLSFRLLDPLVPGDYLGVGGLRFFPEDVGVFIVSAGELKEEFSSYPFINNEGCGFSSVGLPS